MPKYKLPEMSIAQMQYNPATFQGVSFTPQTSDMNILARSLAQAEERQNKASEKQKAWINELNHQGYYAKVCVGFEEAKNTILEYINS